jgi:hypothetical protein
MVCLSSLSLGACNNNMLVRIMICRNDPRSSSYDVQHVEKAINCCVSMKPGCHKGALPTCKKRENGISVMGKCKEIDTDDAPAGCNSPVAYKQKRLSADQQLTLGIL